MPYKNLHENAREAAEFLKTLGNEWRLMVLCSLGTTEKSVSTLEGELGIKQSALSQHLARLRREGLVKTRRESQTIYHSTDLVIQQFRHFFPQPPLPLFFMDLPSNLLQVMCTDLFLMLNGPVCHSNFY